MSVAGSDEPTSPGVGERLWPKALRALGYGVFLDIAVLVGGYGLVRWWAWTIDCGGDCQPQYFAMHGLVYMLFILPWTYIIGCTVLAKAVARGLGGTPVGEDVGFHVGVALVVVTLSLVGYFVVGIPQTGYDADIERRMNIGVAMIPGPRFWPPLPSHAGPLLAIAVEAPRSQWTFPLRSPDIDLNDDVPADDAALPLSTVAKGRAKYATADRGPGQEASAAMVSMAMRKSPLVAS